MKLEAAIRKMFKALKSVMDERLTRLWAGAESEAMGRGGIAAVSRATGLAICTVQKGRNELRAGVTVDDVVNVRRKGAGGRKQEDVHPGWCQPLKMLVDPATSTTVSGPTG